MDPLKTYADQQQIILALMNGYFYESESIEEIDEVLKSDVSNDLKLEIALSLIRRQSHQIMMANLILLTYVLGGSFEQDKAILDKVRKMGGENFKEHWESKINV